VFRLLAFVVWTEVTSIIYLTHFFTILVEYCDFEPHQKAYHCRVYREGTPEYRPFPAIKRVLLTAYKGDKSREYAETNHRKDDEKDSYWHDSHCPKHKLSPVPVFHIMTPPCRKLTIPFLVHNKSIRRSQNAFQHAKTQNCIEDEQVEDLVHF